VNTEDIAQLPEIKSLGMDAMDSQFDFKFFDALLEKKKKMAIGILLMDQHLLAGIGNIYRSEILFVAGVLPERKNETLTLAERKKIFQAIRSILKKAIRMRGTTDSDYRDTSGAPGGFQKVLQVYGKTGEKCQKCATIVARSKMGQRSIFYCPVCQK
ncbi:MAG: zinc finger domain-containing protein, partial [Parcubacteria group bacterium]|jgi:formamidopyrimidine-DNA glycosylase